MKRSIIKIDRSQEKMIYLRVGAESEAEDIWVYNQLLRNSSPFFDNLYEVMGPNAAGVIVPDVSKQTMSLVLDYIYQTFKDGEAFLAITANNVDDVWLAAEKFELEDVKSLCCVYLDSIREENCIRHFMETYESASRSFKTKCLDVLLSALDQLLKTLDFGDLTINHLALIIREGRAENKCSEDVLCEAIINWLENRNREISDELKQLVIEFPRKEHKKIIIKTLRDIPNSDLQNFAFDLLMKLYDEEINAVATTSKINATETNADHSEDQPHISNQDIHEYSKNDCNDNSSADNTNNNNISIPNYEAVAPTIPMKRTSSSVSDNQEHHYCSKPSKNGLSAEPSAAKRIRKTGTEDDINSPVVQSSANWTVRNNFSVILTRCDADVNSDNQSTLSSSSQENELQDDSMLEQDLHFQDNQVFRSVESDYSSRPFLSISLQKKNPRITMVSKLQDQKIEKEFQRFSELSEELKSLGNYRKICLSIWDVSMESQEIVKFMDKFASDIWKLKLDYGVLRKLSPIDLQKRLCKLPNLNCLILATIPSEWKLNQKMFHQNNCNSAESGNSFSLPNVKTILFGSSLEFYPEFMKDLFQIMPNLENVQKFPVYCWSILAAGNGLNILDKIKNVNFSRMPRSSLSKLEQDLLRFSNISKNTKLESAELRFKISSRENGKGETLWESCCKSVSTILRNNQSTIEQLVIEPLPIPQLFDYPEMPEVKKIRLVIPLRWKECYNAAEEAKFFGEEFDARKIFPNLAEVTIVGAGCALDEFVLFFPQNAFAERYFANVTSLNLDLAYAEALESLEDFAELFPAVTSFYTTGNVSWLENRFVDILHLWPNLTSLKLKLDVFFNYGCRAEYPLDLVFTGIPAEKCTKLRQHSEKLDFDVARYRQNLANITTLKDLTLIFHGNCLNPQRIKPLVSHVSYFYAFQYLPDLKVTFAIPWDNKDKDKIREMLSPIKQYVIFNPNY